MEVEHKPSLNDPYYTTPKGCFYHGLSEEVLNDQLDLKGKVKLIFTSPPFPFDHPKKYGNFKGDEYIKWLSEFAPLFSDLLTSDGSIIIEIGNTWNRGSPTVSTIPIEAFLKFKEVGKLHLCQEFIRYTPDTLPRPSQWVCVERIRLKDAFTKLWWFSKTPWPDASNRRVLNEYTEQTKRRIKKGNYRMVVNGVKPRPPLKDNGGSIASDVIVADNSSSSKPYVKYCREHNIEKHPTRMAVDLVEFFIKFLTVDDDIVLDPFGGSNTTGAVAEKLNRRWVSIEPNEEYIKGSIGRFAEMGIEVEVFKN